MAISTRVITVLHNPHNFGGTLLRPVNKVGCLVRTDPVSIPVIVDHGAALLSIQEITHTIKDINTGLTIDDLFALPTPDDAAGVMQVSLIFVIIISFILFIVILSLCTFFEEFLIEAEGVV